MTLFPKEIEVDLLRDGFDIHDWHRGTMSSRRLLLLIDTLHDKSEFRRALRKGDWSDEEYINAGVLNELKLMRVDQASINGQDMPYQLLESPAQIAESARVAEERRAVRSDILRQLHGGSQ